MSNLRELTAEELILVAGGLSSKTVVVSLPIGSLGPGDISSANPGMSGGAPTGSGSTGADQSAPYHTIGTSDDANKFADEHVKNEGMTLADQSNFYKAHDDLAKFYDYAKSHLDEQFDIGNGKHMSNSDALKSFDHIKIRITVSEVLAGSTGARTLPSADGKDLSIYINPNMQNQEDYAERFGKNSGTHYVIFHEIGHALNYYAVGGTFSGQEGLVEGVANTAGRSIEKNLGIPLMQDHSGTVRDPEFGYR